MPFPVAGATVQHPEHLLPPPSSGYADDSGSTELANNAGTVISENVGTLQDRIRLFNQSLANDRSYNASPSLGRASPELSGMQILIHLPAAKYFFNFQFLTLYPTWDVPVLLATTVVASKTGTSQNGYNLKNSKCWKNYWWIYIEKTNICCEVLKGTLRRYWKIFWTRSRSAEKKSKGVPLVSSELWKLINRCNRLNFASIYL